MKRSRLILWALLRLPILAAGVYLFRFPIIAFIEEKYGLGTAIDFAVFSASTFGTRLLLYIVCVTAFGLGIWLAKKWIVSELWSYIVSLIGIFIIVYVSFAYLLLAAFALLKTSIVVIILAINTLPENWLAKWNPGGRIMNLVFLAGVGLSEAFLSQAYAYWLMEKLRADASIKKWSWLSGVVIAPLFWIFLLTPYDNQRILTLGETLHANPSVEKFAQGDFNWIEFNPEQNLLYAVGRRTNFLLAFDTENLNIPPHKSQKDIGKAQSFAFNPEAQEIYVYEAGAKELHYIDAVSLETLRSIPVSDLSPGDVWVKWNRATDAIIISSEADQEIGTPLVMVDRASGEVAGSMSLPTIPTAYLIFHPEKPRMYFNSFRDTYLVSWDMVTHETITQTDTSPRTDRMEFNAARNELLIASPLEGAILRYDADTLEFKGKIKASLGDRTLTIDSERNLLLVGNFINNRIQVIDLDTFEPVASFYIGPWIRTIALDVEGGVAYISTVRNLFKVRYVADQKK